jgi:hypothetical protein
LPHQEEGSEAMADAGGWIEARLSDVTDPPASSDPTSSR